MKEYQSFSSNINQVITAVLNSLFFLQKDFARTKSTKKHQKFPKSTKRTKSTEKHQKHKKAQKRNQAKAQNANKRTKIKNVLKKHLSGKK